MGKNNMSIALREIGTPRLVIRPLNEEDVSNIYGIMSDYETASKAGFKPLSSPSEAEGFFRESIRSESAYGITLKDKPSDIFGIIILFPDEEKTGEGGCTKTVEIGYFMRANMRGNGYMPEAVDAVKAYIFNVTDVDKLIIYLFPENNASRRVVEKCGFSFDELVTEAGRNKATDKMENLEFYSLTRADYYSGKGVNGGYLLDIVIPGRILSEGCPGVPVLHEFYEGNLCGLKNAEGKVIFEPVWDKITQWKDADVIYAKKGDNFCYFNTKGEHILTEVEPLEGVDDNDMPYYTSEEQGRPEMMTFTFADGLVDNRCCFLKGRWVRVGRILHSKAKEFLREGNVLPFSKEAFDEFRSPFTYIYSAFEVTKEGQNDIQGCVEELRLMGCYDSSWHYLTSVFVSPLASDIVLHPSATFAPFEKYLTNEDLHRVSVGVDSELQEGAVRVRQIRYFKDRWPLPEELDYCKAVVDGTCAEMIQKRGVALYKIKELSRPELKSAAVKDFISDIEFPGEIYRSKDWTETVKKIRQLLTFGYRLDEAIWQVVNCLCSDLLHSEGSFDFGCAENLIRWLKTEGAEVNHVRHLSTPLDKLNRALKAFQENGVESQEMLSGIKNMIDTVKELGGSTVYELWTACGGDIGAVLSMLYPWTVKN